MKKNRLKTKRGVFVVVFDQKREKVLLVKRRDIPLWVLPGGEVELGESIKKGAIREVWEETGFTVELTRKVATYLIDKRRRVFLFEGRVIDGMARSSPESVSVRFFSLKKLPVTLFPVHRERIEDVIRIRGKPKIFRQRTFRFKMAWLILTTSEWRRIFWFFLRRRFDDFCRIVKKI